MKPFRFPLQSLRVLRQQKERAAQQLYSEALRQCEEAAARVKSAGDELAACWTSLRGDLASGVNGIELLRARAWCNVLELRLKEKAGALEHARLRVDSVWKDMIRATQDREALDRFHDKRHRLYEREAQREEQKRLDELGLRAGALPAALGVARLAAAPRPRL